MEQPEERATLAVPASALVVAGGAAVFLGVGETTGFLSEPAEDVFILTALMGWRLLVWASIVSGCYAVALSLQRRSRRPVSHSEVTLAVTSLALVAIVMATHPPRGPGSGFGGDRPSIVVSG